MSISVLGLALYGPLAASTRYRLTQFAPGLKQCGVDLTVQSLLSDTYVERTFAGKRYPLTSLVRDYFSRLRFLLKQGRYDALFLTGELFPLLPGWIDANLLRVPYVYDFDDALFLKYRLERFRSVSFLLNNKFDPVVSGARAVLAGNSYLAKYGVLHNPATRILPTVVDTNRFLPKPGRDRSVFTVGWIGSPSTSIYLQELKVPLEVLGREGRVRLVMVGGKCDPIPGVDIVNLPWSESTEVELINTFDVGIMPLFDDEWARGKCAFKLIQYMACGVPVIASPVGTNCEVVTPTSGILAADSDAWTEAFRTLRDSPTLRSKMGDAGRERVVERYSLQYALPLMADTLKSVAASR